MKPKYTKERQRYLSQTDNNPGKEIIAKIGQEKMNQYYKRMIELQPHTAIVPEDSGVIDLYMSISKIELSQQPDKLPQSLLKRTESEEALA